MAGAVERSVQLLKLLASNQPPATVTEVAARLNVSIASASRMVQTLVDAGAVQRNDQTGKLDISVNLIQVGAAALRPLEFRRVITPAIVAAVPDLKRPVNIGVPSTDHAIWLESISLNGSFASSTLMGVAIPYHAATMGKAILAFLPAEHVETVLSRGLQPYTAKTIVDVDALRSELALIRDCRFAINRGEFRQNGLAIAVPVINAAGFPVAAFSVPASEEERDPEGELIRVLSDLGKRLSDLLGHGEEAHDSFV